VCVCVCVCVCCVFRHCVEYSTTGDVLTVQVLYKLPNTLFNDTSRMLAAGHSNYLYYYYGVRSGLGFCLSNSHKIFLMMQHCRSLSVTIQGCIVFPAHSSSKRSNKCFTTLSPTSLPNPPLPSPPSIQPPLHNLISTQSPPHPLPIHPNTIAVNTQCP
jgi:hypothetical protein